MNTTKSSVIGYDDSSQYVQSYITYKDEKDVAIVIAVIQIFISGYQRYDVFFTTPDGYLWHQQTLQQLRKRKAMHNQGMLLAA